MKVWLVVGLICLLTIPVFAGVNNQITLVRLVNGKEIRFRLEAIDESKIVGTKPGPERIILSRSEVSWMRFRPEIPKKIPPGLEGVLLSDGTVILGSPIDMDDKYYWLEDSDFNRKKVEMKKVIFIQLGNSKAAIRIPAATKNAITSVVHVNAANKWTSANLMIKEGQQIWFTVSYDSTISCLPEKQSSADGISQESISNLTLPAANFCSLIGRVGDGQPFLIGLQRTPVIAETSGQLFLGINDSNVSDNKGELDVFVKIARAEEKNVSGSR